MLAVVAVHQHEASWTCRALTALRRSSPLRPCWRTLSQGASWRPCHAHRQKIGSPAFLQVHRPMEPSCEPKWHRQTPMFHRLSSMPRLVWFVIKFRTGPGQPYHLLSEWFHLIGMHGHEGAWRRGSFTGWDWYCSPLPRRAPAARSAQLSRDSRGAPRRDWC